MINKYRSNGLFSCTKCGYREELCSHSEFIQPYSKEKCNECGEFSFSKYLFTLLFINDKQPEQKEIRWGMLENEVSGCRHCHPAEKIEWTNVLIECINCNAGLMKFVDFIDSPKEILSAKQEHRIKMLKKVDFSAGKQISVNK